MYNCRERWTTTKANAKQTPNPKHQTQGDVMNPCRKALLAVLAVMTFGLLFCMPAIAGEPTTDLTVEDQAPTAPAPQKADPDANDDRWHFVIAPYLWFPGVSGTVGARGHNVSVHKSATDILGRFDFGLMGSVEARKNRWLFPIDAMWIRLGDNRSIPETDIGATSINVHVTQTLFTPRFGYRVFDTDRWKFDALAGIRYWYLGESFSFQ